MGEPMRIRVNSQLPQTVKVNSMYAVDPPMKHYVFVKKRFPGDFL